MRIVVGLGNPGRRYMRTRHNAGFMVVDELAVRWRVALQTRRNGLRLGRAMICSVPVMLVQPQQYMNVSGESLASLDTPWRAEDLVVAHDDMDLNAGQLRIRHDGGFGGHRGLESLGAVCGREFDRVRIGVGRPPEGIDPADYVLEKLDDNALEELRGTVARACLGIECLLADGISQAMNRFNARANEAEGKT